MAVYLHQRIGRPASPPAGGPVEDRPRPRDTQLRRPLVPATHPTHAVLIVGVAESSLRRDREDKGSLYARAGIGDYWIVNLVDRVLEVYREPGPARPRLSAGATSPSRPGGTSTTRGSAGAREAARRRSTAGARSRRAPGSRRTRRRPRSSRYRSCRCAGSRGGGRPRPCRVRAGAPRRDRSRRSAGSRSCGSGRAPRPGDPAAWRRSARGCRRP
ncbi:MAG: Uma2 family endonuclease [Candidatus Rokubacteria bacterium]|nr:Uma2 family endonuclease [Candidatus Rokubacteria bacterium]